MESQWHQAELRLRDQQQKTQRDLSEKREEMESRINRTIENRRQESLMLDKKRNSVLSTHERHDQEVKSHRKQMDLDNKVRREMRDIRREQSAMNFARINKMDQVKRDSLMAKIQHDQWKIQMIADEKARIAMERTKQQKLGEIKKLEILKQVEKIKSRGGKISEEDMAKLGISRPVLYSPSGDLQSTAVMGSYEAGLGTAEPKEEPKFGM